MADSGVVDSDLIPSRVNPVTLKLVFTASLLDAQHERDSVKKKPASLLVVPFGKTFSGMKGTVWRRSRQVYLLSRLERCLAVFPILEN